MSDRYSSARIKVGLLHFMLGKGASAIAGFAAMLLVIRELSVSSFAAYSILVAMVEIITAISGFGLVHALLRYVPELYAKHYQLSLKKFLTYSICIRVVVLFATGLVAYYLSDAIAPKIGLGAMLDAFKLFLLVVVVRSITHFISQILESTLHQGNAQLAFLLAAIARLVGMLYLAHQGNVTLIEVIWIELIADVLSLLVMLVGLIKIVADNTHINPEDDGNWPKRHLKQIAKFALTGYLQHLAITPYGGHANRLVGGGMLSIVSMANYGFAQSIYEYIKRYMPAQLLVGLIRPIVVARYSERKNFSTAANLCNQVMLVNVLLIIGLYVILMVAGKDGLMMISAGKYGADALLVLSALFLVLLLETQRQQLDLLVQTVERYQFLIYSNALLASSILLAFVLIPFLGAVGMPLANVIGLLVANAWVNRQLNSAGFTFKYPWFISASILLLGVFALALGEILKYSGVTWYWATLAATLSYGALAYVVSGSMVKLFIGNLMGKTHTVLPPLQNSNESNQPLKIAFGVLSSKQSTQAVDDIAKLVFPHAVYVHHDFSKMPDFSPNEHNVVVLKLPVKTSWGDWSLVEASYKLMETALQDKTVTHFQLLSESSLPVRPINEFEAYLLAKQPEVMIDILPLSNRRAIASHGWRYFSTNHFVMRVLRRITLWLWGTEHYYQAESGVNLRLVAPTKGLIDFLKKKIAVACLKLFAARNQEMLANYGFNALAIGGQWFATNRAVAMWLIETRNQFVTFTDYYRRVHIPDESYFQTLIYNAQQQGIITSVDFGTHALFWDNCGTGPDEVQIRHVEKIKNSGKFMCRKFSLNHDDQVRAYFKS
ncbi:MAG: beta-1,6-N-acetylglucosaminyltransferase [Methylophilus sp.]